MAPISYSLLIVPASLARAAVALVVNHRGWLASSTMGLSTTTALGLLLPHAPRNCCRGAIGWREFFESRVP